MESLLPILQQQLAEIPASLGYLLPEFCLAISLIISIFIEIIEPKNKRHWLHYGSFLGLALALYFVIIQWPSVMAGGSEPFFYRFLLADGLSWFVRLFILISAIGILLIGLNEKSESETLTHKGEYHALWQALILGALILSQSTHLLMVYLSIELMSISAYLLVAMRKGSFTAESAIKYLLFGGMASAFSLYGISWLYGITGTLSITSYDFIKGLLSAPALPIFMASLFTIGGILFKISAVPFHFWVPDVYKTASTPVVTLLSIVPKLAALVIMIRLLKRFDDVSLIFVDLAIDWQLLLSVVAMATVLIANLAALWQQNLKRLLAYSSIAHGGFLMMAIMAFTPAGIHGFIFYSAIYLVMNLAAFLFIQQAESYAGVTQLSHLSGLGRSLPLWSIGFSIVILSFIGLPPTAGFTAKFLVFGSVWEAYQSSQKSILLWVFLVGLGNTVLALFYYLKIPYYLFFKEVDENQVLNIPHWAIYLGTFLTFLLLWGFIQPHRLLDLIYHVNFAF